MSPNLIKADVVHEKPGLILCSEDHNSIIYVKRAVNKLFIFSEPRLSASRWQSPVQSWHLKISTPDLYLAGVESDREPDRPVRGIPHLC